MKKSKLEKCPICKKQSVIITKEFKKNWPHGRKSSPVRLLRRIKKRCKNCRFRKVTFSDLWFRTHNFINQKSFIKHYGRNPKIKKN